MYGVLEYKYVEDIILSGIFPRFGPSGTIVKVIGSFFPPHLDEWLCIFGNVPVEATWISFEEIALHTYCTVKYLGIKMRPL